METRVQRIGRVLGSATAKAVVTAIVILAVLARGPVALTPTGFVGMALVVAAFAAIGLGYDTRGVPWRRAAKGGGIYAVATVVAYNALFAVAALLSMPGGPPFTTADLIGSAILIAGIFAVGAIGRGLGFALGMLK